MATACKDDTAETVLWLKCGQVKVRRLERQAVLWLLFGEGLTLKVLSYICDLPPPPAKKGPSRFKAPRVGGHSEFLEPPEKWKLSVVSVEVFCCCVHLVVLFFSHSGLQCLGPPNFYLQHLPTCKLHFVWRSFGECKLHIGSIHKTKV